MMKSKREGMVDNDRVLEDRDSLWLSWEVIMAELVAHWLNPRDLECL